MSFRLIFWRKVVFEPLQAGASKRLREEGLELGSEAGVEPAIHDRVGERGGERHRVAQPQHKVVRLVILKKGIRTLMSLEKCLGVIHEWRHLILDNFRHPLPKENCSWIGGIGSYRPIAKLGRFEVAADFFQLNIYN